jgi:putative resolvase
MWLSRSGGGPAVDTPDVEAHIGGPGALDIACMFCCIDYLELCGSSDQKLALRLIHPCAGRNGSAPTSVRILSDACASLMIVEHRVQWVRFEVDRLPAVLAEGRRIVVVDDGETTYDPLREMIELLPSMHCTRNWALWAVTSAKHQEPIEAAG